MSRTAKLAFRTTIPILLGYVVMGAAFGLLLVKAGFSFLWAAVISILVYSGSMQFVAIELLSSGAGLFQAALMTLAVNFRHVFYGISLLSLFQSMGRKKWFMVFSLTDETYSLLCSVKAPDTIEQEKYKFFIMLFNYLYWICGSVLGALLGEVLSFNSKGADFAMTALFIVIVTEQWQQVKEHLPAVTGGVCAAVCLALFGAANFVIPALVCMTVCLLLFRKRIEQREKEGEEK